MSYPINTYPPTGSANENVLFASLGSFWTQVFKDQAVLEGLTLAHAEAIFQTYYDLIEAIDSYSAKRISIFSKIKWQPILIKKSDLNSNVLLFGENDSGVSFGSNVSGEPYIFGAPEPQQANVYVIELPASLMDVSILTNRVISPDFVLVNNLDIKISGNQLFLYGDPFQLKNVCPVNILDDNGNQVYYTSSIGQTLPDQMITLWCYNAHIDTNALNYNIAYLFGVNLPSSQQSKDILSATVGLFSGGPSIQQLKAICGAFIGVKPIIEEEELIVDICTTDTAIIVSTDQHIYRFPTYYSLIEEAIVGNTVYAGDVLVNAIEYYDNVIFRNWWLTKLKPNISDQCIGNPQSPSLSLPPQMFIGNYKYGLTFKNEMDLITMDANGVINFPVVGNYQDVAAFQSQINANQAAIANAMTPILTPGSAMLINPLDFLFNTIFKYNTAMLKINFETIDQLQLFTQYFSIIKECLPKHVYFIIFCDINVDPEYYDTTAMSDTCWQGSDNDVTPNIDTPLPGVPLVVQYPVLISNDGVYMNTTSSQGSNQNGVCAELLLVQPILATQSGSSINLFGSPYPAMVGQAQVISTRDCSSVSFTGTP